MRVSVWVPQLQPDEQSDFRLNVKTMEAASGKLSCTRASRLYAIRMSSWVAYKTIDTSAPVQLDCHAEVATNRGGTQAKLSISATRTYQKRQAQQLVVRLLSSTGHTLHTACYIKELANWSWQG